MKKAILGSILLAATVTAHADLRITGGSNVQTSNSMEESFVRLAIYTHGSVFMCGSTLINSTTVITAAHCVGDENTSIKLKFIDGSTRNATGFKRNIEFNINKVETGGDIAVISFNKPVLFKPMTIPSLDEFNTVSEHHITANVIGYGTSTPYVDGNNPGKVSSKMKISRVTLATNNECYIQDSMNIAVSVMCTLDHTSAGTCQGDSGGPIFYTDHNTGNKVLLGITSFGKGCGQYMVPDYYTNMAWQYEAGFLNQANVTYTLNVQSYSQYSYTEEGDMGFGSRFTQQSTYNTGGSGSMGLGLALLGLIGRRFKK